MKPAQAVPTAAATPAPPLQVLLRGIVDYAGLFPPASLKMGAAIAEYSAHQRGDDAWALGRFVLPAARLTEFEAEAGDALPREAARSWALSALVGSDIEEDIARIEQFNARHSDARSGAVLVDTVETKTHTARDAARAGELLGGRFDTYMEVPVMEDPAELIAGIADARAKAKIRMGGVTDDAFPHSAQVTRFVARCIAHGVPFKATAGLHHPWRAEYRLTYAADAPSGTMYGFLNLLLAVAALRSGRSEREATLILEERDPTSARFDQDGVTWTPSDLTLPLSILAQARESMTAFGSCSFREPMADLRAMGLL